MIHPGIFGTHSSRAPERLDLLPDAFITTASPLAQPPPADTSPPIAVGWSLDDLDRRFYAFVEDCQHVQGQSIHSLHSYRVSYSNFRKFLVVRAGVGVALGLALFAIDEWTAWNRKGGMKPMSLNTYWRKLRSFFSYLEKRCDVPSPFAGVRQPAVPARIPKALSPADCRRVLDAALNIPWENAFDRTRAAAIMAVGLFAGLRRSDVLKLQYLDVDLQVGTIRVNQGKGRGGGKDRVIPIAPDLRALLVSYLRERRLHAITAPEFFCSLKQRRGISLTTFRRITARVQSASGLRFTFHALRHSFVTQLLRSGVPLHTAGALAGHSQITTTAGYLRVFDEDKEDAVRKLRF
jgi:integrase